MKTAVITDTASYLDPAIAEAAGIHIVSITVIFGQQTFLENETITYKEFYDKMRADKIMPSTAQVTMAQMQEQFDELAAAGFDEVVCINLSSGITSFFENLSRYAESVENIKVVPFDSKMASEGEAWLTLLAAKMARAGKNAAEIVPELEKLRDSNHVLFAVDNLSHLLHTGRITNSSALIGNLLKIKPILTFENGKIVALSKERTMKRAFNKIKEHINETLPDMNYPVRIGVINGNNPAEEAHWIEQLQGENLTAGGQPVVIEAGEIGPSIGVHTGEGVMGVVWSRDWEKM
ncbi:DegV family protein [Secundilactobacillus malefermentans]|uniref:DegV family protein n=1 Tax=Secundilactobacillus malefermentans TaxID=176292 RepID=A0A4R5NDF3_9LACO|nr:DegV family protein [Secundilactobacillus malefermentans]KRM59036.1 hypothetical protein FD44_GL000195 [Secundilactobacillus malefermentans DSM 5705 = KCTC 3548]QEA31122.1 DegV family protein [Secundilactobacillus malefermentans]TDG71429.1 hypothetical protein C5L31_002216 [Secundilactobacillus malefermentans]